MDSFGEVRLEAEKSAMSEKFNSHLLRDNLASCSDSSRVSGKWGAFRGDREALKSDSD